MTKLTRSVHLKLARARIQSCELAQNIAAWNSRNTITVRHELREGRLGFQLGIEEFVEPPPLDQWGLLVGECVHNLRSSLDNLAFALARLKLDPPASPFAINFPIFVDGAKFAESTRPSRDQMPSEAAALIAATPAIDHAIGT